jgi:DNA topoisomerase-1
VGWIPKYEIIPEKKTHIESMRKVIKKYSEDRIYLATDDDREGEAIAWHICQIFGLNENKVKRIVFHEVTKVALERAIASPGLINMSLVRAQQARQVLDLMVGFRISPVLWKYLYRSKDHSLSAGRCQTPALRLVYDNEKEVKEVSQTYKIMGLFFPKKVEFVLGKEIENTKEVVDFLEASKGFSYEFSVGVKKEQCEKAPKPYNTSALLQAASSSLRMSPKEVMSGCQQLYQEGYITYMRTESRLYCGEFLRELGGYIGKRWSGKHVGILEVLENRDAGNPHEAIRVTHVEVEEVAGVSARVGKLYELIWRNTVASGMSDYKGESTPMYMTSPLEGVKYIHRVEVPIFMGWKVVSCPKTDIEKEQSAGAALILYAKSQKVKCESVMANGVIHGKHSHYTEASLIKVLEEIGIGRPSTYASLVETLLDRGYVKKMDIEGCLVSMNEYVLSKDVIQETVTEKRVGQEKGKLVIQPVGIMVAEFLTAHFGSLFAYEYTREMEKALDEMMVGDERDICKECGDEMDRLMVPVEKLRFRLAGTEGTVGTVGTEGTEGMKEHFVTFGRYGPMVQTEGSRECLSVRKDVDIGKLQRGEYSLEEIIEKKEAYEIGKYEGQSVFVKKGPFGFYVMFGEEKIGFKALGIEEREERSEEIMQAFMKKKQVKGGVGRDGRDGGDGGEDKKMIRELTKEISIRNGKYGAYIHYYKEDMKKPKFYPLKGFKDSYRLCQKEVLMDWIQATHGLK